MKNYDIYLNPLTFLSQNKWNVREVNKLEYTLFTLQDEIHYLLDSFLTGSSLTRISKLLYPLVDRNSIALTNISKLLLMLEREHSLPLESSLKLIKNINRGRSLSPNLLSNIIATLYLEFYNLLRDIKIKREKYRVEKIRAFVDWNNAVRDREYLKPVFIIKEHFQKNLSKELKGFYLHGSLSTHDYVKGWSDIDALAIIKKDVLESNTRLLKFRNSIFRAKSMLYLMDPFQHHGFFTIAEQEMEIYPQYYFPLELFKFATSVFDGPEELIFFERNSRIGNVRSFLRIACMLSEMPQRKNLIPKNTHHWKNYFHLLTLLPCLYLEARGEYYYKKYSFEVAKKDFSKEEWRVIEKISRIRDNWKLDRIFPENIEYTLSEFPNPNILLFIYFFKKRKIYDSVSADCNLNEIVNESSILARRMIENLETEGWL
ncbi:MAG: hypothetical protein ABH874_07120 [Methanobacteriota archaeon]